MRGTNFTAPADMFLAAWIGNPNGDGLGGAEVSTAGTAYVRKIIVWEAPSPPGVTQNDTAGVVFPIATASYGGTVTHCAVFDAVTGGNLFVFGDLLTPRTVATGQQLQVSAGRLDLAIT